MSGSKDLIVKLFVGDVLVDQSTDVSLWQRVLAEIKGIESPKGEIDGPTKGGNTRKPARAGIEGAVDAFAEAIGVTVEELEGGLDPQPSAPFISLDGRSWEALKKNTPSRGQGSVSQTVLAATALALWQKQQDIGDVTISAIKAVMATIDLDDANINRSIANCDWLQLKGARVVLNPSRLTSAGRVLRAYCRREPLLDES